MGGLCKLTVLPCTKACILGVSALVGVIHGKRPSTCSSSSIYAVMVVGTARCSCLPRNVSHNPPFSICSQAGMRET